MPIETGTLSLGILVGGLIGSVASHFLTKSRNIEDKNATRILNASDNFVSAFNTTLANLSYARDYRSTHEAPDIDRQIFDALPAQTEAYIRFRRFIRKEKKNDYDKAWAEYRHWADKGNGVFVAKFVTQENPYDFVSGKIHDLLQFSAD